MPLRLARGRRRQRRLLVLHIAGFAADLGHTIEVPHPMSVQQSVKNSTRALGNMRKWHYIEP
jgi:hypothetical protein